MLKLLTLLLPLLRLVRLDELNVQIIGKFYPAVIAELSSHELLPYGWKTRDKFEAGANPGQWLQNTHLAAYVLDPYWDVDHLAVPDATQALADCIDKIFHFRKAPAREGWYATLIGQLRIYKRKEGLFAKPCASRSAKQLQPSAFLRTMD